MIWQFPRSLRGNSACDSPYGFDCPPTMLAMFLILVGASVGMSQPSGSRTNSRQTIDAGTDDSHANQSQTGNSQAHHDKAVRDIRTALRQTGDYPWYDRETDKTRRIDVAASADSASQNRNTDWEKKPRQAANPSWSGFGNAVAAVMKVAFWIFIFAILAALIWLLVRVFLNAESRKILDGRTIRVQQSSSDVERVESLPFKVKQPRSDLLGEAQRQYNAGNYRDAMIYLFSYMLVHLDKRQLIHLAKGKTNRQYLWEIRPKPRLFQLLENSMIAFEDVFFGNHRLEKSEFEKCWQGLDEFHHLVNEGTGQ